MWNSRSSDDPKWDDPGIPCGNSPPLPWWPVWVAALAWVAWIAFLVAMVVLVLQAPPS